MPLYEYRCDACDHRFEILQRLGEGAGGLTCPSCGGADLEKQFSTFSASTSGVGGTSTAAGAAVGGAPGCGTGFT